MAKSGGAWKVAYADFVTAMMAFFLVMWICAQDQKVRQSVADYFADPMGYGRKPIEMGGVWHFESRGSVPKAESVDMGQGRKSHTPQGERGLATKLVSDWIALDEKKRKYWQQETGRARAWARHSKEVREGRLSLESAAAMYLARQLKEEVRQGIQPEIKGLYQGLLLGALEDVNWRELAEDLIALD